MNTCTPSNKRADKSSSIAVDASFVHVCFLITLFFSNHFQIRCTFLSYQLVRTRPLPRRLCDTIALHTLPAKLRLIGRLIFGTYITCGIHASLQVFRKSIFRSLLVFLVEKICGSPHVSTSEVCRRAERQRMASSTRPGVLSKSESAFIAMFLDLE